MFKYTYRIRCGHSRRVYTKYYAYIISYIYITRNLKKKVKEPFSASFASLIIICLPVKKPVKRTSNTRVSLYLFLSRPLFLYLYIYYIYIMNIYYVYHILMYRYSLLTTPQKRILDAYMDDKPPRNINYSSKIVAEIFYLFFSTILCATG
jgi:hypothetical protein